MKEIMADTFPSITLHSTEGNSDKIFKAWITANADGTLNLKTMYGRRLGTMTYGAKDNLAPEKALKAYEKLVNEKITGKSHYRPIDGNDEQARVVFSKHDGQHSGVPVKLLNAIDEDGLAACLRQPGRYAYQVKHDGHRRLFKTAEGTALGINRRKLIVPLPGAIADAAQSLDSDAIVDGELVQNQTLFVFDAQRLNGKDLTKLRFVERAETLKSAMRAIESPALVYVPYCVGSEAECTAFVEDARAREEEGVVVTEINAPYRDGRPATGGQSLKFKFWNTLSAVCLAHNEQNSVVMGLLDANGDWIDVGNVTVTSYPPIGAIMEIRYQYAFPLPGGCLNQPTFRMLRDDIDAADCTVNQLVFKRTGS
jgi:bifunctional non-homologous end joining protein LigD